MTPDQIIDVENSVICDLCNEDYTTSHAKGGFLWYKTAQALAAQHAKTYGHVVKGEVGLAFTYDGTLAVSTRPAAAAAKKQKPKP